MCKYKTVVFVLFAVSCFGCAHSEEQKRSGWTVPEDLYPTWVTKSPEVCIDEGHFNYHTASGRFAPFADLLRADGYSVQAIFDKFEAKEVLRSCEVLVIANALSAENADSWALPVSSAFSENEINVLTTWISEGGSLLLIADHLPFAGAVEDLAGSLGFVVMNGYTVREDGGGLSMEFSRSNGLLNSAHPIFSTTSSGMQLNRVLAYEGHAFRALEEANATSLFLVPKGTYLFFPKKSGWNFEENTPKVRADGLLLGATREVGDGHVAIFSEAGMFTSQTTSSGRVYGFGAKGAEENHLFVQALLGWLAK